MRNNDSKAKTFLLGALFGGVIGAATALLFAPKSGKELRRDIADTTADMYDKATDLVIESKQKAQHFIDSAKQQADSILHKTSDYFNDVNEQITTSTESVQQRFEHLKDAAKASSEVFKSELKK